MRWTNSRSGRRHCLPVHRHRTTTSAARSTSNRSRKMLEQPMIEKLLSMRLQGMADALKAQEQDPGVRELSFVERLSLLVDQQWNWRENQALARRLKSAKLRHNAYRGHRLPGRARTGEDRHTRSGEGLAVGAESREPFRSRADR